MNKKNPLAKSEPLTTAPKKKYQKPKLRTESLMTFGALCNGTATGGRKQTAGAPDFCNAGKLLS